MSLLIDIIKNNGVWIFRNVDVMWGNIYGLSVNVCSLNMGAA